MGIAVVTGGAGFIGSNLVRELLRRNFEVRVIDNYSSGFARNLQGLDVEIVEADLRSPEILKCSAFKNADSVFHLAADVDNRFSWEDPYVSLTTNVVGTLNVALAARDHGISNLTYASTGTIYGANNQAPFKEEFESSSQTSLYGATKFSGESLLSVFAHHYDMRVTALRFVGILGPHYSHGHVFDFVRKLRSEPNKLSVLGDGYQRKAYVHVSDVCSGLIRVAEFQTERNFEVYNLGRSDSCVVRESLNWILEVMGLDPELTFESSPIGWIGDNPNLVLDTAKILETGWEPLRSIEDSVKDTTNWLLENGWIFQAKG